MEKIKNKFTCSVFFSPQKKVFDRVRTEFPARLKKIKAMEGDLGLPGLGLSAENRAILVDEVSVVFNGAASLRLEAGLKDAVRHNTTGTKHVLDLALKMKNLAVSLANYYFYYYYYYGGSTSLSTKKKTLQTVQKNR